MTSQALSVAKSGQQGTGRWGCVSVAVGAFMVSGPLVGLRLRAVRDDGACPPDGFARWRAVPHASMRVFLRFLAMTAATAFRRRGGGSRRDQSAGPSRSRGAHYAPHAKVNVSGLTADSMSIAAFRP